jgi:hypothetical protein
MTQVVEALGSTPYTTKQSKTKQNKTPQQNLFMTANRAKCLLFVACGSGVPA